VTNDGAHFCIQPTSLFTSKPKCPFMVDFHMVFHALLFGSKGFKPQIEGQFGCVVSFMVFLYYVLYVY
jgi:hypothetical protein